MPSFDQNGYLPEGTYQLDAESFVENFCKQGSARQLFYKPFMDICEWADEAGATSIIIGGSFISSKESPSDLDLLILFKNASDIPKSCEQFYIDGVMLDIQLLSEDNKNIVDAFITLLSTSRRETPHGIIQIKFDTRVQEFNRCSEPNDLFEIVKTSYLGRKYAQTIKQKGLIIPIHGIRTDAPWMPMLTLIASTSGWAVAPYIYGNVSVNVLRDTNEQQSIINGFRDWISAIRHEFNGPISIIAHSFGSYIIGKYIQDSKDLDVEFDAVILCGAILARNYNWNIPLQTGKVGKLINTISEGDEWVKFMPEGGVPIIASNPLFGKSGQEGFVGQHPDLVQVSSSLLQHNNIFKHDVIRGCWLPHLELSRGTAYRKKIAYMMRERFKQENPE